MDLPDRKHPARAPVYDHRNRSNILFITVCTHARKRILDNQATHELLVNCWQKADHWLIGRYVILPDHIHLFCAPAKHDHLSVKSWIAYWKSLASRRWPNPNEQPVWQIDAWDVQLRKGDSYRAKWEYVRQNPVRHNLTTSAENWPYRGELNRLEWHD